MQPKTIAIAFFDVLGTEERSFSRPLSMLVRAAKLLARIARRDRGRFVIDAVSGAQQQEDGTVVSPTSLYTFDPEFDYRSDSIIIWSIFDRARIFHFCDACADFFCDVLEQRIPLRGGIAVGVGYMDKNSGIYVGRPLAEAVRVEAAQAWIGVSFGPSFTNEPHRRSLLPEHVLEFTAHRKSGHPWIPGQVLDWPRRWRSRYGTSPAEAIRDMNTDARYSAYYEMTLKFIELSATRALHPLHQLQRV